MDNGQWTMDTHYPLSIINYQLSIIHCFHRLSIGFLTLTDFLKKEGVTPVTFLN